MPAPASPLDPISVAVALAGAVLGPAMAGIVGAYGVILLGWLGGALVGLWRRDPSDRLGVVRFLVITLILTLGATVPASQWLDSQFDWAESGSLLFPVAFLIPAIGTDWVRVGRWALNWIGRRFDQDNAGGRGGDSQGGAP